MQVNANTKTITAKILKQAGFTLAELTVVLLIGALLAAAAIYGLPRLMANYRAGKIVDEFNTAIPAVQTAFQNQTSFANLTTEMVAKNKWMNDGFIEVGTGSTPTGNLVTSWGSITFEPASSNAQAKVTMTNIPVRECLKISEMFNSDNFLAASINSTSVKTGRLVDLTAVGTQCNSSTANTLSFNFGRA